MVNWDSNTISLKKIKISDKFWKYYMELIKNVVIPYQWEALNDRAEGAPPSGAIKNFRIAAGEAEGEHYGYQYQDSDVGKWLEAVAYSIEWARDPELEKTADEVIELLGKAQQPDGYLNTCFTIKRPGKRWTDLWEGHELYNFGHLTEAAAAYYEATGKRKLLDIMCRFADYIDTVFGYEKGKLHGYDGHPEVELALVKLYHATQRKPYLTLAAYFADERGKEPYYFDLEWEKRGRVNYNFPEKFRRPSDTKEYNQTHTQPKNLTDAVGHAVRLVYLASGMADLAAENNDEQLYEACLRIFSSIVNKRMYITGAIGSTRHGEAFSFDYDLPNDRAYAEECASIGLIFFAHRMLKIKPDSRYGDLIERILYNSLLSGISLDGRHFFYVNPLEVHPEICLNDPDFEKVKPIRQKWFGCACCPPNMARFIASIGKYVYTVSEDTVFMHLYIANRSTVTLKGNDVCILQTGNYPWDDQVKIKLELQRDMEFNIAMRIPWWAEAYTIAVNEAVLDNPEIKDGYAYIKKLWKSGDILSIKMKIPVMAISAHPDVKYDAGKIAVMRGPVVYCMEEADNGKNLHNIAINPDKGFTVQKDSDLPLSLPSICANEAFVTSDDRSECELYRVYKRNAKPCGAKFVPYFIWGNRNQGNRPGEMTVWVRTAK